jgi:transposase
MAVKTALKKLPDDPSVLKGIIADQSQRIVALEEYIRLQNVRLFGAKTEKHTGQHELFNEAELCVVAEEILSELEEQKAESSGQSAGLSKKPGRKPLPPGLPRIRIEHDIPESEIICACGCMRTEIGEETSEQLDIIPAKIQVLQHVRKKYACKQCETGITLAPLPLQPIPKSNASPGLLAYIATSKYQDALPLYRLEDIIQRAGVELGRNTLANWMIKAGTLIQPLLNLMLDQIFAYPVLQCDETSVQVLKEPGKEPSSKSYMWVLVGGPATRKIIHFNYADSRAGEVARELMADYRGYLQTDDYSGYNGVGKVEAITHLGCMAHARRKFVEAQKAVGKNKKSGKANTAINLIARLYAIERRLREAKADEDEIYRVRQQEALPQLEKLRQWLDATLHAVTPKGLLGKALSYLDKNWTKLTIYTQDGRLSIDNNGAENAIRPFVVGRKNWLFSASVRGAKASANLYSLIETAKANGKEPYVYLKQVFTELPKAESIDQIEALLPWNISSAN